MVRVGIWEQGEGIAATVRAGLAAAGLAPPELTEGSHPAAWAEDPPALLVVSPQAVGWAGAGAIRCRTALLPGGLAALARSFQGAAAVSYGSSPKDTLTLSSLEGDQICVAVQRELVTLDGRVVERQELVLPFPVGCAPQPWLAAVGTLLLLGVPPEVLV